MGPNKEGLFRVLYHIEREVGWRRAHNASNTALRSASLRLPTSQDTILESILLWNSFLINILGKNTPMLILIPIRKNWMDIIIGEPTETQLYCLRASLKVIPLTSSIPYNMDSGFTVQANKLMEDSLGG